MTNDSRRDKRVRLDGKARHAYILGMDREHADLLQQELKTEQTDTEAVNPSETRELHEHWERDFGEKVRQWRQARSWSQEDLAEKLRQHGFDMHQTTVAKLERGARPLRVAEAAAIAVIFGVPPLAVFLGPPPERMPWALEQMQEALQTAEQAQATFKQMMYDSAKHYADQVAAVADLAKILNEAALNAQRPDPE